MIVYRCTNDTVEYTITIQDIPSVSPMSDQIFCPLSSTSIISLTGNVDGTNYTWTNDNITIGLGAGGIGDIPSFNAVDLVQVPLFQILSLLQKLRVAMGIPTIFQLL